MVSDVMQDLNYAETDRDEVEDMLLLLAYVKERFPEVEGVSSGAIASDYQRLRVEHVRKSSIHGCNSRCPPNTLSNN
jgi:diphthine-ammonia ligase